MAELSIEEKQDIEGIENIIDYFLSHKEKLSQLTAEREKDILKLSSYIAADNYMTAGSKNKGLNLLYHSCFYFSNMNIEELWNVYWFLNRILFEDYHCEIEGSLDELYGYIYSKVKAAISNEYEKIEHTDSNLVIMVTDQFLDASHAPTRRIMDYAYTLAASLGKKVMVINDSGLHFRPSEFLGKKKMYNYYPEYNNVNMIPYKGLKIPFIQVSAYMPDLDVLDEVLHGIYQLRPELVYNIGGSNLSADLCSMFTKTACFPCSTDIPISMSEYLLVGRNLNDNDQTRLKRLKPYQKVIETVINYELPESREAYERALFDLKENDLVIGIVGNRLDEEISDEFIFLMDEILERQDVHFLIIGGMKNVERIKNGVSKRKNLHFTGKISEASQVIKLCDIYLNPKRSGGGRSGFEALIHGVPVITPKYGDVYYVCGDEFGVDTDEEVLEKIKRYITDEDYLKSVKGKAWKRAELLSDLPGTQRKILEEIL